MYELVAVAFGGTRRASEVLEQLQLLNADWTINLHDAVAVHRADDGRIRLDHSIQPTRKTGAAMGGLLGGLLGALVAAPFTAGASVAAAASLVGAGALGFGVPAAAAGAAEAADWKEAYGVPETFVEQMGGFLRPGESAILAVFDTGDPVTVAERFRGYGGRVLHTRLVPKAPGEAEKAVEAERVMERGGDDRSAS